MEHTNLEDILAFPEEILMKILACVPKSDELVLVCKKFYELVCKIEKNKKKLNAGNRYKEEALSDVIYDSIMHSKREFDEFDIWIEFQQPDDFSKFKQMVLKFGAPVKILEWSNHSPVKLSEQDFVEVLQLMPNLKQMKLSSWRDPFEKSSNKVLLGLSKLDQLELTDCDQSLMEFFSQSLFPHTLKNVCVTNGKYSDETWNQFTKMQSKIENLNITGKFLNMQPFQNLKLTQLKCILVDNDSPSNQCVFLKDLICCQKNLVHLDTLTDIDYSFMFVNDEIFREICKLEHLETLKLNIDGISSEAAQNIPRVKTLEVKTNRDPALQIFNEWSLIKNSTLEKLVLRLWSFEIPAETYRQFGENYDKLRSLRITLGTRHKVNFYMEAFPAIESIDIKFGEANDTMEFEQAYDETEEKKHLNMKSLKLQFWGSILIDTTKFFKMRKCFTNLETLHIHSKFPFTSDFFSVLLENIGVMKCLDIGSFQIRNKETFPDEIIKLLKQFPLKLKYCKFFLLNLQECFSMHKTGQNEDKDMVDRSFTYEPLIKALEFDYKIKKFGMSNIRIYNKLILVAGSEK